MDDQELEPWIVYTPFGVYYLLGVERAQAQLEFLDPKFNSHSLHLLRITPYNIHVR